MIFLIIFLIMAVLALIGGIAIGLAAYDHIYPNLNRRTELINDSNQS